MILSIDNLTYDQECNQHNQLFHLLLGLVYDNNLVKTTGLLAFKRPAAFSVLLLFKDLAYA
jgi:hypothetical protein